MYSSQISRVGSHYIPGQSALLTDLGKPRWQLDQKGFLYSYSRALVSRIVIGDTNVFVSFWACKSPPSVTDRARDASGVAILRRAIINLSVLKYLL